MYSNVCFVIQYGKLDSYIHLIGLLKLPLQTSGWESAFGNLANRANEVRRQFCGFYFMKQLGIEEVFLR